MSVPGRSWPGPKFFAGEHRHQFLGDPGGAQPGHRVRELLLLGQPAEELLQGPELVAGIRVAVPAQKVDQPPLHVVAADLSHLAWLVRRIRWAAANQATASV